MKYDYEKMQNEILKMSKLINRFYSIIDDINKNFTNFLIYYNGGKAQYNDDFKKMKKDLETLFSEYRKSVEYLYSVLNTAKSADALMEAELDKLL